MAVETVTQTEVPERKWPTPALPSLPPSDASLVAPDVDVLAKNITEAKDRKKGHPTQAQLAEAITQIELVSTMKDVNSLVITVEDPDWTFLDSGFFDTDENSEIDPIDVNYPNGTRFWWRLTQVSPDPANQQITLTFLVRAMVWLLHHAGLQKADRAKMTRAQFLKSLCDMASKHPQHGEGKIEFYSRELDVKQPIQPPDTSQFATVSASNMPDGKASKAPGLGANASDAVAGGAAAAASANDTSAAAGGAFGSAVGAGAKTGIGQTNLAGLTVKGSPINAEQVANVNTIIQVGVSVGASTDALVASIMCAIQEDNLQNDASTGGTFQETPQTSRSGDLPYQALCFFTGNGNPAYHGGHSGNGGIIGELRDHPGEGLGAAVQAVQISAFPSLYDQWEPEARKIVQAAGGGALAGGTGGGGVIIEPYYFEIKKGETFWDGMKRLADEVNWELFWDGDRLYYDSEQTLIKQKVAAKLHRDDEAVIDWPYDWDARQIVSQMELDLVCEMNQFRAGEVFDLSGGKFGPASTGSSAKPKALNGRWLIQDCDRVKGDLITKFTLVQPDLPKLEPAPQIKAGAPGSGSGGASGVTGTGVAACVAAAQEMGQKALSQGWSYDQGQRTLEQGGFQSGTDCSGGVSWILLKGGFSLPNGVTWGGWAPVSGDFEGWGQAGPGQQMTVWCNSDHIFIEFNVPSHAFFDSGHTPTSGNVWWDSSGTLDSSYVSGGGFTPRHWPGT